MRPPVGLLPPLFTPVLADVTASSDPEVRLFVAAVPSESAAPVVSVLQFQMIGWVRLSCAVPSAVAAVIWSSLTPPPPPVPDAMITQLAPLLCSSAQAPAVAGRIEVVAVPPAYGMIFD